MIGCRVVGIAKHVDAAILAPMKDVPRTLTPQPWISQGPQASSNSLPAVRSSPVLGPALDWTENPFKGKYEVEQDHEH
jgi:hypothetical protein